MPVLRLATPDDAVACLSIYRPFVESTHVTFETEVPSPDEFRRRLETTLAVRPWVVADDGARGVAGYAYASALKDRAAYQWSVEVAVYVADSERRRGLGRTLYAGLFRVLRAQGFVNAVGVIALPNEASVGLHEAMGFRRIALLEGIGYKHGAWRDVGWWQLALQAAPASPAPPLALADCGDAVRGSLDAR